MARPLWSGTIAFGIVSIPVQLFPAIRTHDLHFHQISKHDHKRIHYQKVVHGGESAVASADIAKGYEMPNGRYVVFEEEELRALAAERSSSMAIESFSELSAIDPRYVDDLFYLFPGKNGEKPYHLLHQALAQADLVGVSRLVMHGKEHLVLIRSFPKALGVQTLHYADEIIDPAKVGTLPQATVTDRELSLARQLIESMTKPFKPAAYQDEHLARLKAAIARKARGQSIAIADEGAAQPDDGKVIDLMAALDRSLQARAGAGGPAAARTARDRAGPNARSMPRRPKSPSSHRQRAS